MRNAMFKDTMREIKRTFSRFISIFMIVALGSAFFAGIKASCPDMKITADHYFDDYNLMDIRLLSTIGFNNDDVNKIKKISSVKNIFPTYSMDAIITQNNKDMVLKVLALPSPAGNNITNINRSKLIKGRFPENPNECVADKGKIINSGMAIGNSITLNSGTDKNISESLRNNKFKIVGLVETPYYISYDRGTSPIGNGKVNSFILIPEQDFKIPAYTDIYLTVKDADKKLCYDKSYNKIIDPVKSELKKTADIRSNARYNEIVSNANNELQKSKKEFTNEKSKQTKNISDAQEKLDNAEDQIKNSENELNTSKKLFSTTIQKSRKEIETADTDINNGEKEYADNLTSYNAAKAKADKEFADASQKIGSASAEMADKEDQLNKLKMLLLNPALTAEQKAQLQSEITIGQKELADAGIQINIAKSQLEAKEKDLSDAKDKITAARISLDNGEYKLKQQKSKLDSTIKSTDVRFSDAEKKINISKEQLSKNKQKLQNSIHEFNTEVSKNQKKLDDAENKIKSISKPTWYVLDRNTIPGFVDYGNAADRMNAISKVFPVFFFLISALVCLTTMTRMVDEQRIAIGTLKALGYSKQIIASKYLFYAAAASVTGSLLGTAAGFKIFPTVIFNAYGIMYSLPHVITEYNMPYAIIAAASSILATTLAALFSCYNELVTVPSQLMLPKAPKPGKRVWIENIKCIWSKLNFTQKITVRNLFRYKKRFLMTVIGISGCTALLLAGFGLKDSIKSIVSKQYYELYKYDMAIDLKTSVKDNENNSAVNIVSKDSRISNYMLAKEQNIEISSSNFAKDATLFVPQDKNKIKNFILLRNRISGKSIDLTDNGVVLTEKLAKELHASVGGSVYVKNTDNIKVKLNVTGITENYVYHYMYMSPSVYKSIYGHQTEFTSIIAKTTSSEESFENSLSTYLLKNKGISAVTFTTGISKTFNDIIKSLNYVVLVLIVSAGALAFIVLYNLTNINVTERIREIATIKVLGFYDNEVSSYVCRENIILMFIGLALGLVLGVFLNNFIVVTAEVDYVMFGRKINTASYVYSALLTIGFAVSVNIVMYFKLKKISMVESMKSVD